MERVAYRWYDSRQQFIHVAMIHFPRISLKFVGSILTTKCKYDIRNELWLRYFTLCDVHNIGYYTMNERRKNPIYLFDLILILIVDIIYVIHILNHKSYIVFLPSKSKRNSFVPFFISNSMFHSSLKGYVEIGYFFMFLYTTAFLKFVFTSPDMSYFLN